MNERLEVLKVRAKTALVLILVFLVLLGIATLGCWSKFLLCLVAITLTVAASYEFAFMTGARKARLLLFTFLPVVPALVVFVWTLRSWGCLHWSPFENWPNPLFVSLSLVLVFDFLLGLSEGLLELELSGDFFKKVMPGHLYLALGGASLATLCLFSDAEKILFWLVLVTCINDTMSYFIGSWLQGPKLAPGISPNKTVSGSVGGLILGIVVGYFASGLLGHSMSTLEVLLLALCVTFAGQMGDLCESYLKRIWGVKDAGSILKGHGGFFDRIDSHLGAFIAFILWVLVVG